MPSLKRSAPPVDSDDEEDSVVTYRTRSTSAITPSASHSTRRNAVVPKPAAALGLGKGSKLADRKGKAKAAAVSKAGKAVTPRVASKPTSKVARTTAPPLKRVKKVEIEEEMEGARKSRRSSGKKPEHGVLLVGAPEAADDFWDEKAVRGKGKRGRAARVDSEEEEEEEEEDEEEPVTRPVKASRPSPKKAPHPAPTVDSDSDSDEAIFAQLTLVNATLPSPISTPPKPLPQLNTTTSPISTPSRTTPIFAPSHPPQPRAAAVSIFPSNSPPQSRPKGIPFFPSSSPPQSRASASPPIITPTKAPLHPVASTSKAICPPSPATSVESTSSPARTPIKATRIPIASTSKAPLPSIASDDEDASDEDPMTLVPSPTKPSVLPSPTKTPTRRDRSPSTSTPTTIRQSARARKLPIAQSDIASMPRSLQSDLVGWHGDYESDVSSDDELEVSPSSKAASKGMVVHERMYEAKSLYRMLGHLGAVVNGIKLPPVLWTEKGFDETRVASWPCVQHMDEWEKPMRYAMGSTVKDGVGNCLIVLGPRGVGKTMIVKRSILVLEEVYGQKSFIVVKLNGLVQTTDRAAMRSIARQLKSQGFEDEEGDFGSNAATMATLLRMLEPSDDPSAVAEKPIIIILDELDLFAQHPRQSFLYCLFDIVQGNRRKAGLAVIGISARTDCLSILEKRVRSRCQSHVLQMVRENSWEEYMDMARYLLRFDERLWRDASEECGDIAVEWNAEVETFLQDPPVVAYFDRLWKIHGNTPTYLRQAIAELYCTTEYWTSHTSWAPGCPAPDFIKIPTLDVKLLAPQDEPGKRNELMGGCSILELAIIIAGKHLRVDQDNMMNLEMLYDCYLQHTKRNKSAGPSAFPFTKSQFCMGLDQLREREVFIPYAGRPTTFISPSCANTFKFYKLVPWASTIDDETNGRSDVPQPLKRWNKNSLV